MLRSLVAGILAVTAVASCKEGGDAPVARPGARAGKVVEVVGTVTATRGGESRALAAGAEVSGDDLVETAADGRIVIVLDHNRARWELGANKRERVASSLAWGLARQEGPATGGDEATTAAGRHGEKSAASTASMAAAEAPAAPEGARAPAPEAEEPAPAPVASPPPPPPPPSRVAPPRKVAREETAGPGVIGAKGRGGGMPAPEAAASRAADAAAGGSGVAVTAGSMVREQLQAVIAHETSAMKACLPDGTSRLTVELVVEGGRASFRFTTPVSDETRSCFAKLASPWSFPAGEATVREKLELRR